METLTAEQIRALIQTTLADLLAVKQEERAMTRQEFCQAEDMSLSTYHKMRKQGYGPDEVQLPGMSFVRITPQARREWHERMDAWRKSDAAKLERARRVVAAKKAADVSKASPNHVSRKPKKKQAP